MNPLQNAAGSPKAGFNVIELTIVIVILGVLTMMAVPRYQAAVEQAMGSEAFTYLVQVESAQERHHTETGEYAQHIGSLEIKGNPPAHFTVGNFTSYNWQSQWELRLTRQGASSGYGAYTVTWDQDGFVPSRSSIHADLIPIH